MFSGVNGTSDVGIYKRDTLLAQAARAGGSVVTARHATAHGEYSGYFADTDGNFWRVASRG